MPGPARRAAVLGRPITHSLSPVLHRAAYAELGLDWTYEALDCGVDELPAVLAARSGWAGFSCTMPLKRAVLDVATSASERAVLVGSANTLTPGAGGWRADNTDVVGVREALREHAATGGSATLLGAGGTAQAAVVALGELGVQRVEVLVRDPARACDLLATAGRAGVDVEFGRLEPDRVAGDIVVSTLPAGAADGLAAARWRAGQVLLDVVYAGWPTPLARAAASAGVAVVGGALMLLHQAGEQVRLMTGREAPLPAMRAALRAAAPDAGL